MRVLWYNNRYQCVMSVGFKARIVTNQLLIDRVIVLYLFNIQSIIVFEISIVTLLNR